MKDTLNNKIFKMLAALILGITLVLLGVVWNSTSKSITDNLTNRLGLAESVVSRDLINRQQTFIQNAQAMVDDIVFQRALIAGNQQTIQQALESYRVSIDASFVSIKEADGQEIESAGELYKNLNSKQSRAAIKVSQERGDALDLLVLNERLVWVLYLPIISSDRTNTSYAVIGMVISEKYLQSLKAMVSHDISVLTQENKSFVVSSLPYAKKRLSYLEESLLENNKNNWLYLNSLFNSNTLFSRKFTHASASSVNQVIYISADGSELKSQFLQLQITIGAIALIALMIAIIIGRLLSQQITRPLEYIAQYAANISRGDYSKSFELDASSTEIDQLLKAFKSMEFGVKQRESEIQFQAQHDMLTKLHNRNYFTQYLNQLFSSNTRFQAIGINISGFRTVNDVFGYQYGDGCVRELAKRVKDQGGASARITGGEILWIPTSPMHIEDIAKLKVALDKSIQIEEISLPITTSIGILDCPKDTHSAEDLFRRMNIVIDEAQLAPGLIAQFSSHFEEKYLRRLAIIHNLRLALSSNSPDLSLAYQPKINLATLSVKHAEALIRWNDKELGFVPPDEFILIAEQAGLIHHVTTWVLQQVTSDISYFKKQGIELCIAVNISAQDLLDEEFTNRTRALLKVHELSNTDISFELTESVIVQDPEKSIQQMQALRDEGFSLAIDDFGTGYSSLSYITRLPVDTIKIDKCFVIPLATSEGEQSICKAVLNLASNFNMQVVAEGVEDMKSMAMLKKWGCKYAQGYHISRPIPASELVKWLKLRVSTSINN